MKKLLRKEVLLSMHPTAIIFLALSMMLIIPNYPYYVIFFYTGLAIFFLEFIIKMSITLERLLHGQAQLCLFIWQSQKPVHM